MKILHIFIILSDRKQLIRLWWARRIKRNMVYCEIIAALMKLHATC